MAGSHIRKEKVADSKISRYVGTGPEMIVHANRAVQLTLDSKTKPKNFLWPIIKDRLYSEPIKSPNKYLELDLDQ